MQQANQKRFVNAKREETPSSSNPAKIRGGPEGQVAYLSWRWSTKARLVLQGRIAISTTLHGILYITEWSNNSTTVLQLKRRQLSQSLKSLLPVDSGTPFLTTIMWEAVVKDTTILVQPYVFDNNWFAVVQFGL